MIDPLHLTKLAAEREKLIQKYLQIVLDFFQGDTNKAYLWWTTPNPAFGNISPMALMYINRGHKVFAFIHAARDGDI